MEKVKRSRKTTLAQVVSAEGEILGEIARPGTVPIARLANVARREFKDPTVTVRHVRTVTDTYSMPAQKFFELAEKEN